MLKKSGLFLFCLFLVLGVSAQEKTTTGMLTGNLLDEKQKAIDGATIQLLSLNIDANNQQSVSDKSGQFSFSGIGFGYYKLHISYVGLLSKTIDSIWFRAERYDFNLSDIVIKSLSTETLEEVVIYAEKPLVQSINGNITFNVGESALAAGSSVSELLNNVPLVAKDADGKITVRGKEPKILIDDKPVELNMQQLQDLLESMPGSSIDKIEVMTNPPPQYANEQGGVINIVTKKGKVGVSGRIAVTAGTRGETTMNGSLSYREKGLAINLNTGIGHNRYEGSGYSSRNNFYSDSSNFFNTTNKNYNKNLRPNVRLNVTYDINKNNSLNLVLNYNQNNFNNTNNTEYRNINRFNELWKLSRRQVQSEGNNYSPAINAGYTWKGKPGETFKINTSYNFSSNGNNRIFYQQFFNPDDTPNGLDSTQQQLNNTKINSYNVRVNYDKMLANKKTFLSLGTVYNRNNNHVIVNASYKKKPEGTMEKLELLSNDFWFHQTVSNLRGSIKQVLSKTLSVTAGTAVERTAIWFELLKESRDVKNHYLTWLPFATVSKTWKEKLTLTLAYRRNINRPGITQLNPAIDFSDPYNIRFGNEKLVASTSHIFDLVAGRTKPKYYINLGMGYHHVQDVFSQVRTLLPEGKTQITWENISGRKEYELSSWNGITLSKKIKVNGSASYTYSRYSAFDIAVRRYRNGGSFTSNVNSSYTATDTWNITGGFNINRFGNPQGFARWNTSMNLGIQHKLFKKKLIVTTNVIDPFVNQQRRIFTYGKNFNLESFNITQTRNFRLSVAYSFTKTQKKKPVVLPKK